MTWEFADLAGRRAVAWGAAAALAGALLLAAAPGARGAGLVLLATAAALVLAGLAGRAAVTQTRGHDRGEAPALAARARATAVLRDLLAAALVAGLALAAVGTLVAAGPAADAGAGAALALQGTLLAVLAGLHRRWLPDPGPILPAGVPLFADAVHHPFRLAPAGAPAGGALLLHGFVGTPAELRPLAAALAADGWLVEAPLLPGHGPALRELPERRTEDWLAAVEAAADGLRAAAPGPLLVVGYSVGGALAVATASRVRPDRLALLAPFWWPERRLLRPLTVLARLLLPPGVRMFERLDLGNPDVRRGVGSFLPGLDLDDPATTDALRRLAVPMALFEQLLRLSRLVLDAAPRVGAPVLAVQGLDDRVVEPGRTRRLLAAMPAAASLVEVRAEHDLLTDASPAQAEVIAAVRGFAAAGAATGTAAVPRAASPV